MDRTAVLDQLAPLAALKPQNVTHTAVRLTTNGEEAEIRIGRKDLPFSPEGVRQLLTFAGVAPKLAKALQQNTLSAVMGEMLGHKGQYMILQDGDQIVGVQDAGPIKTLAPERVLRAVEAGIKTPVDYARVLVDDGIVQLETVGEKQHAVLPGDIIRAGTLTRFSPMGIANPTVRAYDLRMLCTNGAAGMQMGDEFKFTGGEGDDVWQWFRQQTRDAYRSIDETVARYRQLANTPVIPEERAEIIEGMLRRLHLFDRTVAAAILARAMENPPENEWDLINLASYATTHVLERPAAIFKAQAATAEYVAEAQHRKVCPTCRRGH